ncbi:TerD family protein [Streptomyces roseirectus]|uniref:TerD family protein n=1 Tax=Streptomyces roseirectus TaxID=2768066 RepID=A0A7H0I6Q1_9ACTN|nr:CAP domain-containing protein [Streptomyces roseirectus]QNP68467.1 TerD family protein [Streptomyces roseirectus]
MNELVPGGNTALPSGAWTFRVPGPFDVSALITDDGGTVRGDADFVFFNQPAAPGARLQGDTLTLDPARLRAGAARVTLVVSPAGPGTLLARLPSPTLQVTDARGRVLARFTPPPVRAETVLLLAEVYRRTNTWKVRALGQGYADGLAGLARDFGVDVEEEAPEPAGRTPGSAPAGAPHTRGAATGTRPGTRSPYDRPTHAGPPSDGRPTHAGPPYDSRPTHTGSPTPGRPPHTRPPFPGQADPAAPGHASPPAPGHPGHTGRSTPGGLTPAGPPHPGRPHHPGPSIPTDPTHARPPRSAHPAPADPDGFLALVNPARAQAGSPPVVLDPALASAARAHASAMAAAGKLGVEGRDGMSVFQRVTGAGFAYLTVGEHLVSGPHTHAEFVEYCLSTDRTRRILQDPAFTHAAVARDGAYWTALWAAPLTPAGLDGVEAEVLALTNRERARAGLRPLAPDGPLARAARAYCVDMAARGFYSHTSPEGTQPWDRAAAAGSAKRSIGENIACGQRSPAEVVEGWMNSPGHRANILKADFTHLGVGFAGGGPSGTYWTQLFGA